MTERKTVKAVALLIHPKHNFYESDTITKAIVADFACCKKESQSSFVIADGENYVSNRSHQRSSELLQERLKIPYRGFHAIRHTFTTRALECGVDVKILSEILGHKNPSVTLNRYIHSIMEHNEI